VLRPPGEAPYYVPTGAEVDVFARCHARGLAVLLKGPTGCGKTRFVQHMAWRLGRPLVTVSCHDDLSASDLTGRYLVRGGETVWVDGPLAAAARAGAICYLDEVVEARQDTVVVVHPLTDDRRVLPVEKTGELIEAAPGFPARGVVQPGLPARDEGPQAEHAPALRRARVRLPGAGRRGGHRGARGRRAAGHGGAARRAGAPGAAAQGEGLAEGPGTRLVVAAARLIADGIAPAVACQRALAGPAHRRPRPARGVATSWRRWGRDARAPADVTRAELRRAARRAALRAVGRRAAAVRGAVTALRGDRAPPTCRSTTCGGGWSTGSRPCTSDPVRVEPVVRAGPRVGASARGGA
jgi:nitric oxide reductase NorQ protein